MFKLSPDTGLFDGTKKWLEKAMSPDPITRALHRGGEQGVAALSGATPVDTGLAAGSWRYEVQGTTGGYTLTWYNDDIEGGQNVVLLLQYGHGTGTGGWVEGRDFINPAIRPVMDDIINEVMKEVTQ